MNLGVPSLLTLFLPDLNISGFYVLISPTIERILGQIGQALRSYATCQDGHSLWM